MDYVRQSLSAGEEIVYVGQFHWLYTFHALLSILWGFLGMIAVLTAGAYFSVRYMHGGAAGQTWISAVRALHPGLKCGALLMLIMGLFHFAHLMVIRATTEVAVTSSRIVYKRGLVGRYVGEMSIDRIEGVNILQSVMGRIFGYGRILVRGMGVGEVVLPPLANPISFRKAIEKARTV